MKKQSLFIHAFFLTLVLPLHTMNSHGHLVPKIKNESQQTLGELLIELQNVFYSPSTQWSTDTWEELYTTKFTLSTLLTHYTAMRTMVNVSFIHPLQEQETTS